MGFSRKAAVAALDAVSNDVVAAIAVLCESQSRKTISKQARKSTSAKPSSESINSQMEAMLEIILLREECDLQLGLARSMHVHALEKLEQLTLEQVLNESRTLIQHSP